MRARLLLASSFDVVRSVVGVALVVGFAFAEALGDAADLLRGHEPIRDSFGWRREGR